MTVYDSSADSILTEAEAAEFLRMSARTLQAWRVRGGGPRFLALGRAIRYQRQDLKNFVAQAARSSTSQRAA